MYSIFQPSFIEFSRLCSYALCCSGQLFHLTFQAISDFKNAPCMYMNTLYSTCTFVTHQELKFFFSLIVMKISSVIRLRFNSWSCWPEIFSCNRSKQHWPMSDYCIFRSCTNIFRISILSIMRRKCRQLRRSSPAAPARTTTGCLARRGDSSFPGNYSYHCRCSRNKWNQWTRFYENFRN